MVTEKNAVFVRDAKWNETFRKYLLKTNRQKKKKPPPQTKQNKQTKKCYHEKWVHEQIYSKQNAKLSLALSIFHYLFLQ